MAVSKYDIDLDLARESNSSHWHVADLIGSTKRVLDVGCSTGYFAEALTERGNEVLGVEYDEASATIARERGFEVLTADLETADLAAHFGAGSFDVVVYADVLEHLRDPFPVLRSTHDLLAPGGFVVISLPNIAHGDIRLALLDGKFDYTETRHSRYHSHPLLHPQLAAAIRSRGRFRRRRGEADDRAAVRDRAGPRRRLLRPHAGRAGARRPRVADLPVRGQGSGRRRVGQRPGSARASLRRRDRARQAGRRNRPATPTDRGRRVRDRGHARGASPDHHGADGRDREAPRRAHP